MAELSTGAVVAGYRIEDVAGRGGMGVVYRATQLALDRPAALKVIAPDLADDVMFRERFKRE
ncbi:MAG: serine/threonine protein kinase, partial [Thermoleophilaceae bacterium]